MEEMTSGELHSKIIDLNDLLSRAWDCDADRDLIIKVEEKRAEYEAELNSRIRKSIEKNLKKELE